LFLSQIFLRVAALELSVDDIIILKDALARLVIFSEVVYLLLEVVDITSLFADAIV